MPEQPDHADIPQFLEQLRASGVRHRQHRCDELARLSLSRGEVPWLVLESADPADPAVLYAERYWQRRISAYPGLRTASQCGLWLAGHSFASVRARLAERWLLYAGQLYHDAEDESADGVVADAVTGSAELLADAVYAAVLYRAGQMWQLGAASELPGWLQDTPLALAVTDAYRERPAVHALLAWAAFWDPEVPRGDGQLRWGRLWPTSGRYDPLVAEILLSALASPHHRAPRGADAPGGELLAAHDRLARYAAEAVAAHPGQHALLYLLACGQQETGQTRLAAATVRAALQALPSHTGADWPRQRYQGLLFRLPRDGHARPRRGGRPRA